MRVISYVVSYAVLLPPSKPPFAFEIISEYLREMHESFWTAINFKSPFPKKNIHSILITNSTDTSASIGSGC